MSSVSSGYNGVDFTANTDTVLCPQLENKYMYLQSGDQIANICWIIKIAREFQKNIYFYFIDFARAFVWTTNSWKLLKRWEYQTTWPVSWEICMQVRKQQLEVDIEQQPGSK